MVGFIKNLFSGILSFFVGLFGGKKSQALQAGKPEKATAKKPKRSGYFMELEESDDKSVEASIPAQAAKNSAPVAAKSVKSAEPVKAQEPVAAKSVKSAESVKTPDPVTNGQAPKVELVQTAEGLKAEIAQPTTPSPTASNNGQSKTETTFAPKYLNPAASSNSRRRPGPSMSPFLDMAREVKPSN